MQVLLEKGLSEREKEEMRKQIEKKYSPSTIFRIYPSTICRSYGAHEKSGWSLSPVCHSESLDPLEMLYIVGDEDQVMR